jgi:subtilase family serine protease
MEQELQQIRAANERLFLSTSEIQNKYDLQTATLNELKDYNSQLIEARKTQMLQLQQLLAIN